MPCPSPAPSDCSGLPAVASTAQATYADTFINMLGAITQTLMQVVGL